MGRHPRGNAFTRSGDDYDHVMEGLRRSKKDDFPWQDGTLPLYVYWHSESAYRVSRDAYLEFFAENGMGRKAFPSVARLENDILGAVLDLLNASPTATGSLTSGGTESIFHAVKAARNRARSRGQLADGHRPRIVVPYSAHPAFSKAARILDVDEIRVPIGSDFRVDLNALSSAVDERTILLAGSAPGFPHGVFDDIPAISGIAADSGIWMHVDACVGGMLAPFLRMNGESVPAFDLSVPGVTSLSVDLHKYGFAAKGASLILLNDESDKQYYHFDFDNWPRGSYTTETFLGTRPAGPIASAWAVMRHLGIEGYRDSARVIATTKRALISGIEDIDGLSVLRPHDLSFLLYQSTDPALDINAVADLMAQRGWFVGRSVEPPAIHLMLNPVHAPVVPRYLDDLQKSAETARNERMVGTLDTATY